MEARLALVHAVAHATVTARAKSTAVTVAMLSLCLDVPGRRPQAGASITGSDTVVPATQPAHLDARSTVRDLLRHPAFAGFAHLILPWDDRPYDEQMPLTRIGSLLPYHTHVETESVTSGLNRMIDDVADGKPVFYRFYSDAQRQARPAKNHTGLFFFRGRPGAPFAVIAPGGGFSYVASVHEGFPYAEAINSKGYNAFVLRYRAGQGGTVQRRTWPRRSPTSWRMQRRSTSAPPDTPCGGVRRARGWPPRLVRTAWRATEARTFQSRQRS